MNRNPKRNLLFTLGAVLAALVVSLTAVLAAGQSLPGTPFLRTDATSPSGTGKAGTREIGQGTLVQGRVFKTQPRISPENLKRVTEHDSEPEGGPPLNNIGRSPSRQVANPAQNVPARIGADVRTLASPGDGVILRNSAIPTTNVSPRTGEPSTDNNGKNVFQTGNWYTALSHNNGSSWLFLDPFTIFGGGFCCDQVTIYDSGRNLQFWLLQYDNHLTLAVSPGNDLANWCSYTINLASFGQRTGDIDYNDLALSTNNLFIVSNILGVGTGVLRWPIDALSQCAGFSYNYFVRTDSFTLKPVQGAGETMYFGSNSNNGMTSGSSIRIYGWNDSTSVYFWWNRAINPFLFFTRNSGQNCATSDGVVKNWCQFADSRVLAGAVARGTLTFGFMAKQDGHHPHPYVRYVFFSDSNGAYQGDAESWATWGSFGFPSLAPDARGHLGGAEAWSGAVGKTDYKPGSLVQIIDDVNPIPPWSYYYYLIGGGNPCTTSDGLFRWGDYFTVREYRPAGDLWIATGGRFTPSDCGQQGAHNEPHNVVFGRRRDINSYTRWNGV